MNHVQAFIVNMDIPHDLDELACNIFISDSITNSINDIRSTSDYYLEDENDEDSLAVYIIGTSKLEQYSAPRHAMVGDICFFMCQRTAMQTYTRLRKQVYDLCETNLSYREFCEWFTDKTAFYPKEGKKELYRLFIREENTWAGLETDDYIIVESMPNEAFHKVKNVYCNERELGFDQTHFLEAFHLVKSGNYRYLRFKHKLAGTIIFHLLNVYKTINQYSGKIYAVGVVSTPPENFDYHNTERWRYGIVTDFEKCFLLDNPIDLSEFKDTISFSQRGSFTNVLGPAFENLKTIIASKNEVPDYFLESVAVPIPLSKIDDSNWLEVTNKHRRGFILEDQFRVFYVNRLLPLLGDIKKYYMECHCYHPSSHFTRVDNVIKFCGKYLPVEVKLSIAIEKDILGQCSSYCGCTRIEIGDKAINVKDAWQYVLVIDREAAYIYSHSSNTLKKLIDLDDISIEQDIIRLREQIKLELI
ncbi:hypothetical protein [Butyrivibrio sp. AE2032]|uniref:hypothetical protein n=1 Tax=Butyrivibrio sp. AE2032 TaxID=1458463 RepID=UPI00068E00CF|nr:hypothetical protein [Butyrivibrio sp. AE2032]